MTLTDNRPGIRRKPRPSPAARRFGYLVAALVNGALLYAVNTWPGWDAVPFLTAETERVLPAVNASIVAGVVANLVYLGHDPRWLRGLGDVTTTGFALLAMVRVWQVFPLDLSDGWSTLARVLLVVGVVGAAIGIAAGVVSFVQGLAGRARP